MNTNLPEMTREEMEMHCKVLTISSDEMTSVMTTLFAIDDSDDTDRTLAAEAVLVSADLTQGLIPSKCTADGEHVRMLFYVNSTLPLAVRRFSDGMVVLSLHVPYYEHLVYNIDHQLLIDPHFGANGVRYIIVCSAETAKQVLEPSSYERLLTREKTK